MRLFRRKLKSEQIYSEEERIKDMEESVEIMFTRLRANLIDVPDEIKNHPKFGIVLDGLKDVLKMQAESVFKYRIALRLSEVENKVLRGTIGKLRIAASWMVLILIINAIIDLIKFFNKL